MTEYIKSDLISRLCRSEIDAERLTLHGLAGDYSVSVSPVRMALKHLIEEGYVSKGKNRRLEVNRDRLARVIAANPVEPVPPPNHFATILSDFIRLSLDGKVTVVREEAISKQYGLSRSSVRQIFHRLAGEGVLEHRPRHGWRLRPFTESDLAEFNEIRAVLECKALELAWPHLVDADIQRMLDGNRFPKTPDEEPLHDNSLHGYFIEKADNHYIADFFARHGQYYAALFAWKGLAREGRIVTIRQHRRILKAVLDRNFEAAKRALAHHIRFNFPRL